MTLLLKHAACAPQRSQHKPLLPFPCVINDGVGAQAVVRPTQLVIGWLEERQTADAAQITTRSPLHAQMSPLLALAHT